MKRYTNAEAAILFDGKCVISNNDGTIWICDDAEIYSSHQPEYRSKAADWETLECKYAGNPGFGMKKVKFDGLKKTEFVREQFSKNFANRSFSSVCFLQSRNIGVNSAHNETLSTFGMVQNLLKETREVRNSVGGTKTFRAIIEFVHANKYVQKDDEFEVVSRQIPQIVEMVEAAFSPIEIMHVKSIYQLVNN